MSKNIVQSIEKERGAKSMISFFICLAILIGGYFTYGKLVEKVFEPDDFELILYPKLPRSKIH